MQIEGDPSLINDDLAPTPEEKRTWSKWHIAALWVGMAVCIPTYTLASGLIAKGWSLELAVLSVALGNIVVLFPMILNAHAGTKYGIPFPVLLRSSFGVIGSNIPALMRAMVACGWFGINTFIGGKAIYLLAAVIFPDSWSLPALLPAWFGISTGLFLSFLVFWALHLVIIARGIDSIKILETYAAPLLLFMGLALFVWAWSKVGSLGDMLASSENATHTGIADLGIGLTTAVAFWGTLALNIPDFARYAKSQRDQVIGQSIGLPPTMTAFAFIGAAVTNATAIIYGSTIDQPEALLARMGGPVVTVLAMLGLAIATLTTNLAANVVGPANDFSNVAPSKINFRRGAYIAAGVGLAIFPWKLMQDAGHYLFTWLLGYGALLGAVGGVMIADYYIIRGTYLNVKDLYRRGGEYEYNRGFNPWAIVALLIGIVPNIPGFVAALAQEPTSAVFSTIYEWAWFFAFFAAGGTYVLFMKMFGAAPIGEVVTPPISETLEQSAS